MTPQPTEYRTIKLSKGLVTIVDAIDYWWLSLIPWYPIFNSNTKSFYAIAPCSRNYGAPSQTLQMARVILGLFPGDPMKAHHKDHDTLNNRRENLERVSNQLNAIFTGRYKNNTSGYRGVSRNFGKRRPSKLWHAQISFNGKKIHLGDFSTPEEAYAAYVVAGKSLFGEWFSG